MGSRPSHMSHRLYVLTHIDTTAQAHVQAESFSMHGPIHQHLLNGGVERLNQLGEDIIAKREAMMPTFG